MAKLYIFGIGGTGSRVIKSLTYLLSAGVQLGKEIDTVIPIIIDPDSSNGDYTRTSQLLDNYKSINEFNKNSQGFFSIPIKTLTDITGDAVGNLQDKFKMLNISAAQNQTFREFIGYSSLPEDSKALVELLFTEENLKADMTVGFKGNPNIGSVVLNQFKNSPEYQIFLNSFSPGDSIFIISSIFGGTGAAGFPLLLRNLRKVDSEFSNSNNVANAKIGALSMMPYFKVSPPEKKEDLTIDSSSFMGKAKSALDFYSHSIFANNNQLNAFYTIGEDARNFYEHNDGQAAQKNNAHFLELCAALAIVDFTNELSLLKTKNNKAVNTHFKEFGIEDTNSRKINFKGLGDKTKKSIMKSMAKFSLMVRLNEIASDNLSDFENSPWRSFLDDCYSNDGVYELLISKVEKGYKDWLIEMVNNDISFTPFEMNVQYGSLLNIIEDFKTKKSLFGSSANGKKLDRELNRQTKKLVASENVGTDYIKIFDESTENILNQILK